MPGFGKSERPPGVLEVADVIVLVASNRAGNVTGTDFIIDGGLSPLCGPNSDQLTAHQPSRSPDSYRELVGFLHRRFDKSTGG